MNKLSILLAGLALYQSSPAFAHDNTLICRMNAVGGTDLIATITETEGNLFSGQGSGFVEINPVHHLKIQYPTHFAVGSYYSMKYKLNIFTGEEFAGNLNLFTAKANNFNSGSTESFKVKIRYGKVDYSSVCNFK